MNLQILLSAISPVILILGLGYFAGKHHSFDTDQSRGFSQLALRYALPATLFLGMAHFNRVLLMQQGPIVLVMLAGYSGFFLVCYGILRAAHMQKLKATLLGYTVSSTAVPIYGLTVLTPIYGKEVGAGIVGLAALVTNLTQVAVAIFLLQKASPVQGTTPSLSATIRSSLANPLVWAPTLGAVVALLGWRLNPLVSASLGPLAVSAAGVAIFASGLALAAYPMKLTSKEVILGSLVCIAVKPALFFIMVKGLGLTGAMAKATFVASSMPTATPSVLFAQQYGNCEAETASIMLITTILMVAALPVTMLASAFL